MATPLSDDELSEVREIVSDLDTCGSRIVVLDKFIHWRAAR